MEIIIHRVNTIEKLKMVPHDFGCEIDVRSNGKEIILNHDAMQDGCSFENFLNFYNHLGAKDQSSLRHLIQLPMYHAYSYHCDTYPTKRKIFPLLLFVAHLYLFLSDSFAQWFH